MSFKLVLVWASVTEIMCVDKLNVFQTSIRRGFCNSDHVCRGIMFYIFVFVRKNIFLSMHMHFHTFSAWFV